MPWIGDGAEQGYLPNSIAKIINEKEGQDRFTIEEPKIIKREKLDSYVKIAYSLKKPNYISKETIKTAEHTNVVCDRLYYPVSQKYNLHKLIYGKLFAIAYETKNEECQIVEDSSMIYSWVGYLQNYYKNNNLRWFQIRNVSEKHSALRYSFNKRNIILKYADYLDSIAYCIDNDIYKRK